MDFEKGVPMPTYHDRAATMRRMEIGDSFLVQVDEAPAWRSAMSLAHRSGDKHFVSRTVEGGVRFWRRA